MYEFPCPRRDRLIETVGGIWIYQLGLDSVESFTRFVFEVFRERIGERQGWQATEDDLNEMLDEELRYAPRGVFFGARAPDTGALIAGYRMVRWSPERRFAAERIFGVDFRDFARDRGVAPTTLWHGSQLALNKAEAQRVDANPDTLTYHILRHAVWAMHQLGGMYTIAETDPHVNRRLSQIGLRFKPITALHDYIGRSYVSALDMRPCYESPRFEMQENLIAEEALARAVA